MVGAGLGAKSGLLILLKFPNGQLTENAKFLTMCIIIEEGKEFGERFLQNPEQCGQGRAYCLYGHSRVIRYFFHLHLTDTFHNMSNREILKTTKGNIRL